MSHFKLTLLAGLVACTGMHISIINAAATRGPESDLAELLAQYQSLKLDAPGLLSKADIIANAHATGFSGKAGITQYVINEYAHMLTEKSDKSLEEMQKYITNRSTRLKITPAQYVTNDLQKKIADMQDEPEVALSEEEMRAQHAAARRAAPTVAPTAVRPVAPREADVARPTENIATLYARLKALELGLGSDPDSIEMIRQDTTVKANRNRMTLDQYAIDAFEREQAQSFDMTQPEMHRYIQQRADTHGQTAYQYVAHSLQSKINDLLAPAPIPAAAPIAIAAHPEVIAFEAQPHTQETHDRKEIHTSAWHYGHQHARDGMEDAHIEALSPRFDFFAVYDGHGGKRAADYAAQELHIILAHLLNDGINPRDALIRACEETDVNFCRDIGGQSGTTAIIALIDKMHQKIYLANLADARAVVYDRDGIVLGHTTDHNLKGDTPMGRAETKRIIDAGGSIRRGRVGGILNITRAIGDCDPGLKPYIIATPDVIELDMPAHGFMVLACDGLWDAIGVTNENIGEFMTPRITTRESNDQIARELVEQAQERDVYDNISVTVVNFDTYATTPSPQMAMAMPGSAEQAAPTSPRALTPEVARSIARRQRIYETEGLRGQPLNPGDRVRLPNEEIATVIENINDDVVRLRFAEGDVSTFSKLSLERE